MMFRAALAFFTRLPVGSVTNASTLQGIIVWLPIIGIVIGTLVAFATSLAALILPAALCGLLGCLIWAIITGGLHLDGVADCGDGLVVEASPDRRLEIMKDSCLGTFGGIALFFSLAFKAVTLGILVDAFPFYENWWVACLSLILACCLAAVLARCMVFIAMRMPSARQGGLGESLRHGIESKHERRILLLGLVFCLINGVNGFLALGAALLMTWLLLVTAKKRLGGVTGDVCGCLIELVECTILLILCIR